MKVALAQMASGRDKESNLETSARLFKEALKHKPQMVIFPEYQMFSPDYADPDGLRENSEAMDGEFIARIAGLSRENGVKALINIAESNFGTLKPFNSSVFIDDLGIVSGKYRKVHLFDAYSKLESSLFEPGRMPISVIDAGGVKMGLQICYDLRFPESARLLKLLGAQVLSYQAGWYAGERKLETWKTLLRARAMENGVFVLGTAQCGKYFTGHTLAVNPYGDILAEAEDQEGVLSCELDLGVIEEYATEVPMMKQRR